MSPSGLVTIKSPSISVIVVAQQRARCLGALFDSLLACKSPHFWELILVRNSASDSLRELSERYRGHFAQFTSIDVKGLLPGEARNRGVALAEGQILLFLDDDVTCLPHLLASCVEVFKDKKVSVVGGANLTPLGSSLLARSTGQVFASPLLAGPLSRRYRQRQGVFGGGEESLILCNLAVRREDFTSFPPSFFCGEENALLLNLAANGKQILWHSDFTVYHLRREKWIDLWLQVQKYALGRVQVLSSMSIYARAKFFLPSLGLSLFLAAIVAGPRILVETLLVSYVLWHALAAFFSWREHKDLPASLFQVVIGSWVHAAYATGFIFGWLKLKIKKPRGSADFAYQKA